ncbi:ATP-binding protein [Roseateles sp.]|uniref:ATP-binding protein n=1 Tax=Roseateles sp. TaxID=1971397 RepID=UPI0025E64EB4|nr:ATP-binding protein [Roseateles sp.]MBV8035068.1 DUF4118 domain-containing protein [Roseateles sp.]
MPASRQIIACALPGQDPRVLAERALDKARALDASCTLLVLTRAGSDDDAATAQALAQARAAGIEAQQVTLERMTAAAVLDTLRPWLGRGQRAVLMLQRQHDGFLGAASLSSRLATLCADELSHVRLHVVRATAERRHPRGLGTYMGGASLKAWWLTLLTLLACTLAGELMREHFEPANTVMIYMAGTTLVGLRAGMGRAIAFVLGSVLLYDLVLLPPYWTIVKLRPQYYFTFGVMLGVGCLISWLVSNVSAKSDELAARAQRAQARNDLSYDLVRASTPQDVQLALRSAIDSSLDGWGELLLPDAEGRLRPVDVAGLQFADPGTAARVFATGDHVATGDSPIVLHLPMQGTHERLGVLAIRLKAPLRDDSGDANLLRAFADKAAVVLQRLQLEAMNTSSALEAETERVRNTLLAAISHDFRSPMTTIVGSVSSLLEQRDVISPALRERLLRGVLGEARRVHTLMNNLLDLTRIEGGAVPLSLEWCPVDELFSAALTAQGATLAEHRVSMACDPDALLWCDPRLIEQLLGNVLENAGRHAPAGSRIRLGFTAETAAARLVVQDDGPGFPPGREQDMMKKFTRGSQQSSGGTGLGLAICAAVAKLHGGRLELSNQSGAQVMLWLPQPDCAPITDDDEAP